jgi:flagellar motor switch protein FliN/FliY
MAEPTQPTGSESAGNLPEQPAGAASPAPLEGQPLAPAEVEALLSPGGGAPPPMTAAAGDPRVLPEDLDYLLQQAQNALASVDAPVATAAADALPFRLEDFGGAPASTECATLDLIRDVELDLRIELGRTLLPLDDVLRLRRGTVVTLDKLAGDPVDIFVNGRLIARGEVLVMNDNFCVRVAELIAAEAARAG